jgi:hypothetical protein
MGSIPMRSEVAFRRKVKATIEAIKERQMINVFFNEPCWILPPIITGRTGRTHGARIVSTPDKKEIIYKVIRVNNQQ